MKKDSIKMRTKDINGIKKDGKLSLLFLLMAMIIFIASNNIKAQTADSLVAEALRNNVELKSLSYRIEAAKYRAESADNLPAPTLSVEFAQLPFSSADIFSQPVSQNLSLSQMFMLGGKIGAMTEVERKNALVEKDGYKIYRNNLIAQVKMSYYTLWLLAKKIEVQKKNIELLEDLLKTLNTTYSVSGINQADLLTVKSEIASDKTQLVILNNQVEAESYKLNKLLGRPLNSDRKFDVADIPEDSVRLSEKELVEKLRNNNPELLKMNSMVEMNRAMVTANNKELIPDLMLQGMVMRMPKGMPVTTKTDPMMITGKGSTEYMYSIMASISLPFAPWSINKIKAKEEELYAGISGIEYEKSDMQREMEAKLKEALVKYNTAVDLEKLYSKEVVPLYNQAAGAQVSAYQNNKTNVNAVIDIYRMLLMQKMNYYMAKADAQMALAEIGMITGSNPLEH